MTIRVNSPQILQYCPSRVMREWSCLADMFLRARERQQGHDASALCALLTDEGGQACRQKQVGSQSQASASFAESVITTKTLLEESPFE